MKVIVTGGRYYNGGGIVSAELSKLNPSLVIEGGATGADYFAKMWAGANEVESKTYYADWSLHGSAAGPIRNKKMIDENLDAVLLVFPGGKGTADCRRYAEKMGLKIIEAQK